MKILRLEKAKDVNGATEEILNIVQRDDADNKIIYFNGWNGFGAAAVLRSISQVLANMKAPPPELRFDKMIYIDCSTWESKRVMQRKIAEELKLDQKIMAMFDKQDEEDNFNGVDHGSRNVIRSVAAVIDQTLRKGRFMMIFLNGSDDELILSQFGIPDYWDCIILWTFKRAFLNLRAGPIRRITSDKLTHTNLFLFYYQSGLSGSQFSAVFQEEAASIVARNPCTQDIDPTMATYCCFYRLFMQLHSLQSTAGFGWEAHAPNFWICDGILQGDRAIEISNALRQKINIECDASQLDKLYKEFLRLDERTPFLVFKDDYDFNERRHAYSWISMTSKKTKVHEDLQTLLARASSIFLASQRINSSTDQSECALGLPNGLFKQCIKLHVLSLSYCAFSFSSPPFLHCETLRFLGLDCCTNGDNIVVLDEENGATKWIFLHSLWVLDLRYTDWAMILSNEKMGHMSTLKELNIEGAGSWRYYTSKTHNRLDHLQKLRIIKPTMSTQADASTEDIDNSFMDMANNKLEILDLSGNSDMKNLPTGLTKVGNSLQVLVLDGCDDLENVVLPNSSLRSFSFDGYGPASHWTSTGELPPQSSRPPGADKKKDVRISKISLEGCRHLNTLFLRGLPNLMELDLSGCGIKVFDLRSMMLDVPRLKRLLLLGCENLHAIRWGVDSPPKKWGKIPNFPMELELMCIDTRPAEWVLVDGCARPSIAQHKSFQLQVHVVTADARLARSLWDPIHYCLKGRSKSTAGYFNINITSSSSALFSGGGDSQPDEVTTSSTKAIQGSQQQRHAVVSPSAGLLYGDVHTKIADTPTPTQAFPHPPTRQLDRHVEIGSGSHSMESEVVKEFGHYNLGDLMSVYSQSLHVHDAPASTALPARNWYSLTWCRLERWRSVGVVFPPDADGNPNLGTIWASELLTARCIWSIGGKTYFQSLRHLHLRSCPNLQYAVPVRKDKIPNLETIHIIHCSSLKHVFVLNVEYHGSVVFPKLTTIQLHDLPRLEQMYEGAEMFTTALMTIKIRGCWGLRRLPALKGRQQGLRAPAVEVEKDVWDALEWDGVDNGHHPSLYEVPAHSRYYKRQRLLRGTVLR
ncbi:unnamed protein product [Urochloa decumbens]|uniref:Disease resistance protein At4g27190-like leucine-rich repeats domain-containing protein n=1 Tax=Urochloa decumbens TaxID=240449 RepID=A0ABC9B7H4_9POAL